LVPVKSSQAAKIIYTLATETFGNCRNGTRCCSMTC